MNKNGAIYCNVCTWVDPRGQQYGYRPQVLGSVTPEGFLRILRAHRLLTLLEFQTKTTVTVHCQCGYSTDVTLNPSLEQSGYKYA